MRIIINYYRGQLRWSYKQWASSSLVPCVYWALGIVVPKHIKQRAIYNPTRSASHYLNASCKRSLCAAKYHLDSNQPLISSGLPFSFPAPLFFLFLRKSLNRGFPILFSHPQSSPLWSVSKREEPHFTPYLGHFSVHA